MLCVQLPTYVDDVALPAFAHRKPRCCASCSNRSICSRDVATATKFCLFNPHIFFVTMCNKLCAIIHDTLDRRKCNTTSVDNTNSLHCGTDIGPLGTDISPWTFPHRTFPGHSRAMGYDKKCNCCAGRTRTTYLSN